LSNHQQLSRALPESAMWYAGALRVNGAVLMIEAENDSRKRCPQVAMQR